LEKSLEVTEGAPFLLFSKIAVYFESEPVLDLKLLEALLEEEVPGPRVRGRAYH
jgi:hypothetical protein